MPSTKVMTSSFDKTLSTDQILKGPNKEGQKRVREHLNMTNEITKKRVQELKNILKQNKKLPNHITGVNEDDWLENYLILNKNEIEKAKDNLELYFKLKDMLPEVYQDRDAYSKVLNHSFQSTFVSWCPNLDKNGNRIVFYGHISDIASDYDPVMVAIRLVAIVDMYLKEGIDWRTLIIVCDLKKTKLGHLTRYPIFLMKKFFDYAWKAYPGRVDAIHIINPPVYLEPVLSLFKPFLREKIKNRIKVHSKLTTFYEHVDKSVVPSDFGGDLPYTSLQLNKAMQDKMKVYEDWLMTVKNEHRVIPDEKEQKISKKDKKGKHKEVADINHNDFKNITVD